MARIEAELIIEGGRAIVSVGGALDCSTAHRVGSLLRRLIKEGCADIVVDLDGLERIDAAGVGILRGATRAVGPHGRFGYVNASDEIAAVLLANEVHRAADDDGDANVDQDDAALTHRRLNPTLRSPRREARPAARTTRPPATT